MRNLRVTQIKSVIKQPERQKRTMRALGISKMGHPVELTGTPQIEGMIAKIKHLLKVEEI